MKFQSVNETLALSLHWPLLKGISQNYRCCLIMFDDMPRLVQKLFVCEPPEAQSRLQGALILMAVVQPLLGG